VVGRAPNARLSAALDRLFLTSVGWVGRTIFIIDGRRAPLKNPRFINIKTHFRLAAQIATRRRHMKSILVPVGGSATDGPLLETALAAARPFCGHLHFVHVHIGAGQAAANIPHTAFAMGPALANALEALEKEAETRADSDLIRPGIPI
jgi:hypothetical protein